MLHRLRSVLVLLSVFMMFAALLPLGHVRAATDPLSDTEAIYLLRTYGIVRGDPTGSLGLDERLTRAQAATVFVRSVGAEEYAKLLADAVPFTDAKGHWAAGEMALAQQLGLMRGDGNGTFRPNNDITYAEVLTVLLRMVNQEPEGPWQPTRIFEAATRAGIAPAGVDVTTPAVRGKIFWSLAMTISRVQLPAGQTVLQKYVDSTQPNLTLDQTRVSTTAQTATISGVTTGAVQVLVDGKPATLSPSNGRFTYTANLQMGTHNLTVEAIDLAGNKASAGFIAERMPSIVRLEITGPAVVQRGSSTKLTVSAYDAQNRPVALDGVQVELAGTVATFDLATTTLTTGSAIGRGTLTLQAGSIRKSYTFDVAGLSAKATRLEFATVNSGKAPGLGKATTVKVQVVDANGQLTRDDFGRGISLSSTSLSGVTVTPATATTEEGIATFTVQGNTEGVAVFMATSSGLTSATQTVEFLSSPRIVLTANPNSLRPDGMSSATITAQLQDDTGRAVTNNTSSSIVVSLTSTGTDGAFERRAITIPNGYSSSTGGLSGSFQAGVHPGTATISGTVSGGQAYSVQTLSLPVTGSLPGTKLQFTASASRFTPGSSGANITVRVLDSQDRLVTPGSYAFQVTVATSNREEVVEGLPEGLELTFPNTSFSPVDDGRSANDPQGNPNAVVGRTYQGTATVNLRYNKSGIISLTPSLISPTNEGYHPTTGFGPAAGSTGMSVQPVQITFAGNPAQIKLSVDSALGRDMPAGAVSAATNLVVRARVIDAGGAPVPGYSDFITLQRGTSGNLVTNIVGSNRKSAVNGMAEFTLQTTNTPGYDVYTATAGSLASQSVTVAVRSAKAETPTIAAIRGVREGGASPTVGYVAPDADYMDIQLHRQDPPNPAEPSYWVSAKVYRRGESSPILSDAVVDLNSVLPIIRVPKASLRAGRHIYEVEINNGAGDSGRSPDLGLSEAVNAVYNTNYKVYSGLYDAATGRLALTTGGLVTGTIAKENLTIVKGDHRVNLASDEVTVVSNSNGLVVMQLGGITLDPDLFNGTVSVETTDGWFTATDGSQIAKGGSAPLKPMAAITHAALDVPNKRLYLNGAGFTQGTLSLQFIKIGGMALRPGSSVTTDRLGSTSDAQVLINLSQATLDEIATAEGSAYVTAEIGWLKLINSGFTYQAGAITGTGHPVYIRTSVTRVQYNRTARTLTLTGTGFANSTLSPEKLTLRASTSQTLRWSPPSDTQVVVDSDTSATITLSETAAAQFQSTFGGRNVFLNTEAGWLVDSQGRTAAPIPPDSVLFSVPAN